MFIYVVRKGDSIFSIGKKFDIEPGFIVEANGITSPEKLVVGQSLVVPVPVRKVEREIIVNGYCYPFVNREVLDEALPYMTFMSVFSYQVTSDGDILSIDDDELIFRAARRAAGSKMVITNIDVEGSFSSELGHAILEDEEKQEKLLDAIVDTMEQKGHVGLDVDFEYLYPEDKDLYSLFMERAMNRLHPLGYSLSAALAPKLSADQEGLLYEAHDYRAHGWIDDEVILMTYEWGYLYGPPMAVAPLDQVRRVIEYALTEIPSEKILMGIPNYGYDWTLPFVRGEAARTISNMEAVELAKEVKAEIRYDEKSASPNFTYYDQDKKEHIVWFEDARSIYEKLRLVGEYNLGGISYWTVNNPFPQNWQVLHAMYDVEKIQIIGGGPKF